MACLFGHKWNGCTCTVCGQEAHVFSNYRCAKCGELDRKSLSAIREANIESIDDLSLLADIIRYGFNIPVKKAAVERRLTLIKCLTNQATLLEIVNSKDELFVEKSWSLRVNFSETAVRGITDPLALAEISEKHPDRMVRTYAVWNLRDQRILERVARNNTNVEVRKAAVRRLTDENVLADIALSSNEPLICAAAIDNITDQSILETLARNNTYSGIAAQAIERLSDQFAIADIIKNCDASSKSPAGIAKITDEQLLLSLVREAKSEVIRKGAIHKLGGYFCKDCNAENLSSETKHVSCTCAKCGAENHEYKYQERVTSLLGKGEQTDSHEECIRCGVAINHSTSFRHTDW